MSEVSASFARAHFAELCDRVNDDREAIIIRRRSGEDVALISAAELSSLLETLHLFSSPANAERLLTALEGARRGEGMEMTVEELARDVGLDRLPVG